MSPDVIPLKEAAEKWAVAPVDVIYCDETTARAIAEHRGTGASLIIDARCYLERHRVGGRTMTTLRMAAEQVVFLADPVSSVELSDDLLRKAS